MARSLSDWGVIAEIVSAIAVVLSLIFVGLQIRDNTLATEAAMYQDSVAYDLGNLRVFGASPQNARVLYTFWNEPDNLDDDEWLQGRTLFTAAIRHAENLYVQYQAGMLSDEAWATREPLIRAFALSPGFEALTSDENRRTFGGTFFDYAMTVRAEAAEDRN
ncbi:MAG TPA: hypothetical protein VIV14_00225 [Gammaproteobacteria bacterium]